MVVFLTAIFRTGSVGGPPSWISASNPLGQMGKRVSIQEHFRLAEKSWAKTVVQRHELLKEWPEPEKMPLQVQNCLYQIMNTIMKTNNCLDFLRTPQPYIFNIHIQSGISSLRHGVVHMRWRESAAWEMEENGYAGCPYMNNYPPLDLALSTALVSNSSPAMVSSLVQVLIDGFCGSAGF